MISLQDQIQKFQKLIYNPQLEEFVTVDQMFVGGGITMESIIRQTNFIVEELKKMNSVFLNYCKLNEKVYDKITKHQLAVHNEQAKLNATVGLVDRKMEETMKKMGQIHEDTVLQNTKSHTILMENLEPMKTQLDQKVDQTTFSSLVKKILEENQDQNIEGQGGQNGQGAGEGRFGSDREPNSPYPVKKGKVSYNQFYRFRQQLDAKLKQSDDQVVQLTRDSTDSKNLLQKYVPIINNTSTQIKQSQTSLYKLQISQQDMTSNLTKQINKVNAQLNNRLNDQVWKDKFQHFYEKQIKPVTTKLEESVRNINAKMEVQKSENIKKFIEIDAQILKEKNDMTIAKRNIEKINETLEQIDTRININRSDFQDGLKEVNKDLGVLSEETKKSFKALETKSESQFKKLHKIIEELSHTIEQSVVKVVNKRFDFQLKMIEKSIKESSDATKQVKIDVGIVEEQIKNMKGILSQKANFSDFVHHIEKKADKQDFKQLQTKIHETSHQVLTRQQDSLNLSIRCDRSENNGSSRKIPSINKISNSKTLLAPQTVHRSQKIDFDSGTKLFMCGMEGHVGESRKSWTQTTGRRRNHKASTPVVSDF